MRTDERFEVDFTPITEHMRVRVGGERELLLTDEAGDLGPRAALPVQQADPSVPEGGAFTTFARRPKVEQTSAAISLSCA
jgi:hypothetical protein